jgi:hypothetical protein
MGYSEKDHNGYAKHTHKDYFDQCCFYISLLSHTNSEVLGYVTLCRVAIVGDNTDTHRPMTCWEGGGGGYTK